MLDACVSVPQEGTPQSYVPPAWAVEVAASAPPVTAANAASFLAVFRPFALAVTA